MTRANQLTSDLTALAIEQTEVIEVQLAHPELPKPLDELIGWSGDAIGADEGAKFRATFK